jgi:hypothetical protein
MFEYRLGARYVNQTKPELTCVCGFIGTASTENDARESAKRKANLKLVELQGMRLNDTIVVEWIYKIGDCINDMEVKEIQHDWSHCPD